MNKRLVHPVPDPTPAAGTLPQRASCFRAGRLGVLLAVAFACVAVLAPTAFAGTLFLNEPFDSTWSAGTNWSRSGSFTPVISTPGGETPASAMRLTPASGSQFGFLLYTVARPTAYGLDISFVLSEWGGSGADGMSFFLKKGSDTSTVAGSLGGALGYGPSGSAGVSGALLGIGFDNFGNFLSSSVGGTGCGSAEYPGSAGPGANADTISIRGPGQGNAGYCYLAGSSYSAAFGGGSRTAGARSIRITIDPSTDPSPKVKVWYAVGAGGTSGAPVITIDSPAQLLAAPSFKFGFAAGTGGSVQNNELWGMQSGSLVAIPNFQITTPCSPLPDAIVRTAYSAPLATDYGVGDTSWSITAGTLPAGMTMNGVTGTISGTPTKVGAYPITLRSQDSRATPSVATSSCVLNVVDAAAAAVVSPKPTPSTTGIQLSFEAPAAGTTRTTGIRIGRQTHRRLVACRAPNETTTGPTTLVLKCAFLAATRRQLCRAPMTVRVYVEFTPTTGPKEFSVSTIRLGRVWGCAAARPATTKPSWLIWPYTVVPEPITG